MQVTFNQQQQAPAQGKQQQASAQGKQVKTPLGERIGAFFKGVGHSLVTWEWTKAIVYWLILSAGTASDLVFLLASFWMSVNSNVHELILHYMSEDTAKYFTYLATTAYVALPIFIVALAVVQTVGHIEMWKQGGFWSKVWAITFGIPAITFLVMDFVTISCSVVNVSFTMPTFFVVLRADSAFIFAFGSLVYFFLGKPQERKRLAKKDEKIRELQDEMATSLATLASEKDSFIAALRSEKDRLIAELTREKTSILASAAQEKESLLSTIDAKNDEIESLKGLLERTQKGFLELNRAVNQSEETALQAYGEVCINWLKSGVKSADIPMIAQYTGLTTTRIKNAFKRGDLRKAPNSKDDNNPLILISTLIPWLKSLAVSERKTDVDLPALQLA